MSRIPCPYAGEWPSRNNSRTILAKVVCGNTLAIYWIHVSIDDIGHVYPDNMNPANGYITDPLTKFSSVEKNEENISPSAVIANMYAILIPAIFRIPDFSGIPKTSMVRDTTIAQDRAPSPQ